MLGGFPNKEPLLVFIIVERASGFTLSLAPEPCQKLIEISFGVVGEGISLFSSCFTILCRTQQVRWRLRWKLAAFPSCV